MKNKIYYLQTVWLVLILLTQNLSGQFYNEFDKIKQQEILKSSEFSVTQNSQSFPDKFSDRLSHDFILKEETNKGKLLDSVVSYSFNSLLDSVPSYKTVNYYSNGYVIQNYYNHWNAELNIWEPYSKTDYGYDEDWNNTLYLYFNWDTLTNQWVNYIKREFEYDEEGRDIMYARYYWSIGLNIWIGQVKEDKEYNENGNFSNRTQYVWDTELNQWVDDVKDEYFYDESGFLILIHKYFWEFEWMLYEKWDHVNNSNGDPDTIIIYNWGYDDWELSEKREYTYNEDGNLMLKMQYQWYYESYWEAWVKTEYDYDEYGNRILFTSYLWNNSSWEGLSKSTYAYDDNGNWILYIIYDWNEAITDWVYDYKFELGYDENGYDLYIIYFVWDLDSNEWSAFDKVEYITDLEGNWLVTSYFLWSEDVNDWVLNSKSYYYYSDFNVGYSEINIPMFSVFPNPVSTTFSLSYFLKKNSTVNISIYNQFGELINSLVNEFQCGGKHEININVTTLKSGVYFCTLKTNEGMQSLKMIKL